MPEDTEHRMPLPLALTVSLHCETVSAVKVLDVSHDGNQLVSVLFGDDISGVTLVGQLPDIERILRTGAELVGALGGES